MGFFELLKQAFPSFLSGMGNTVIITLFSLFFATIIGLISCLMGLARIKPIRAISHGYLNVIRGTPLMIQAFFIYFGVTQALDFRMTAAVAGVITLSLNAGAYMSEIFRGGIQAVSKGQMEAARSLGLPYGNAMRKVILPQALRIVVPSLVNQCIITLKDTSILYAIGLPELTMAGSMVVARTFKSFYVWTMIGAMYFVVIYILTKLSKVLERRLSLDNKGKRKKSA